MGASTDGIPDARPFVLNVPDEMPGFDDLLKGLEWVDAKVRPPEPGLIVKRWKWPDGSFSHWAGYFNGNVKMSSCDFWLLLPE